MSNDIVHVEIVIRGQIWDAADLDPEQYKARVTSIDDAAFNVLNTEIVSMEKI